MPRPKSWATLLEWTDRDEQMFQLLKRLLHTQGIELTASTFRALLDEVTQVERQSNGGSRAADEPSLTITASLDNGNMRWAGRAGSVPMTVREAALLQSFRADYPWRGTKEQQHRQVGDAMPPLFAAAILRPLIQPNAREAAA
jgi:site-specific DNA-cytosine methylase